MINWLLVRLTLGIALWMRGAGSRASAAANEEREIVKGVLSSVQSRDFDGKDAFVWDEMKECGLTFLPSLLVLVEELLYQGC